MTRSPPRRLLAILLLAFVLGLLVAGTPIAWPENSAAPPPEQILLTWAGDPAKSISIQWRTSPSVTAGAAAYVRRADSVDTASVPWKFVYADCRTIAQAMNWHTARLAGLQPSTDYFYVVGDGRREGWSEPRLFRTGPAAAERFCFVYMGDAQEGMASWGVLQRAALQRRPDARFFIMAGDLVDLGNDLYHWQSFLKHGAEVYSRRPVMPCVGNHECIKNGPAMYRQMLDLPLNGPPGVESERAYAFTYGDALFVVLDSNLSAQSQTAWLTQCLGASRATWKFAMFHHPAYSSDPTQDHASLRAAWVPVFDRYHVDLVFQGHEHAYMRTYPLRGGERVAGPAEGTIYLISVSGTKMYKQVKRSYTHVAFTNTATYSTIDLAPATGRRGGRLVYRAYDAGGTVRDEFMIDK
jgi:hypothetical protein